MRITTSVACVLTLTVGAARAEKYDCSLWPDVSNDTSVTEISCEVASGTIPSELGDFSRLTTLRLGFRASGPDGLRGPIPSELGRLSLLANLDLSLNRLTGSIPSELASMSSLTKLDLSFNYGLNGSIPSELASMTSLMSLFLGYNKLRGTIPSELASISSSIYLDLSYNKLTGSIPSNINATTFFIYNNYLTGCIDDNYIHEVIGDEAFQNQLCEKLPLCSSGSRCTRANSEYDCNQWPKIPRADELDELQPIVSINCSGMGLGQSIPSEINSLTRLTSLNLSNNNLQGSIPELSGIDRLLSIDLHSNRLVGRTPNFDFRELEKLALQDNQLCIDRDDYDQCVSPHFIFPIEYCDFGTQEVCTSSPAGTPNDEPNDEPNIILILGLIGLSLIGITLVGFFVLKLQKKNNNQEQALDNESGKNAVSAPEI